MSVVAGHRSISRWPVLAQSSYHLHASPILPSSCSTVPCQGKGTENVNRDHELIVICIMHQDREQGGARGE
jgi:hypothetical protein